MRREVIPVHPSSMLPILLGTIASLGLLGMRLWQTSDDYYIFLPYNLMLAGIPLVLSFLIVHYQRHTYRSWLLLVGGGLVWLIFFPNAPYILTDFIHLKERFGVPVWYDALLILSFATTGLLSGYYSLYTMQTLVAHRWGKVAGWFFASASLTLASFGVYLGRFLRWNSWDIFLDPIRLMHDLIVRMAIPTLHLRVWFVAGLVLGFLLISYTAVFSFIENENRRLK